FLEDWLELGDLCTHQRLRAAHDGVLEERTGPGPGDGFKAARCQTSALSLCVCVPRSGLKNRGVEICQSTSNLVSGLNATHTPHHVVQAAVSPAGSRGAGIAINLRKELHILTRTFRKPVAPARNRRTHLARDIRDLRGILRGAGYDQAT